MTRSNYAPRRGFTLIELLVVIAIIAVIASLLAAGVMAMLRKRPEKADMTEMKLLETAIGKFYVEHNNTYPPDYIKLCHYLSDYDMNNALDVESVQILTKMWPHIFKNTNSPVPWAGFNRNTTPWTVNMMKANPGAGGKRCVILQGDQCLVLFLGGAWGTCGFSDSKDFPIHDPANPAFKGFKRTVYHEFPPTRLKSLYQTNAAATNAPYMPPNLGQDPASLLELDFPSLIDNFEKQPFVYFSGGNRGRYNVFAAPMAQRQMVDGTIIDLGGVQPYFESVDAKNRPAKYLNQSRFQIITAGPDNKFGPLGGPWRDGVGPVGTDDWQDNQANFHPSRLGVIQAQ